MSIGIVRCVVLFFILLLASPAITGEAEIGQPTLPVMQKFLVPNTELSTEEQTVFEVGRRLFRHDWVPLGSPLSGQDGLGPLFNRFSCAACHPGGGRGQPPRYDGGSLLSSIVFLGDHSGDYDPAAGRYTPKMLGGQLQTRSLAPLPAEGKALITYVEKSGVYQDGQSFQLRQPMIKIVPFEPFASLDTSAYAKGLRVGQSLFMMGDIETITSQEILKYADPEDRDADGISGKANWIGGEGTKRLGRFGWKASQVTLADQNTIALHQDIGITSSRFRRENCTEHQTDCIKLGRSSGVGIEPAELEALNAFVASLERPSFSSEQLGPGFEIFQTIGCASCHRPSMPTDKGPIYLFSDLLLHDMGQELSDGLTAFEAEPSEWRTAPLRGLKRQKDLNGHHFLLHDGRARSVEEAILWHGGEAAGARDAFKSLAAKERRLLLSFVEDL